jgi:hypothetical protein
MFDDHDTVDKTVIQKYYIINGNKCKVKKALCKQELQFAGSQRNLGGGSGSFTGKRKVVEGVWSVVKTSEQEEAMMVEEVVAQASGEGHYLADVMGVEVMVVTVESMVLVIVGLEEVESQDMGANMEDMVAILKTRDVYNERENVNYKNPGNYSNQMIEP